MIFLIGAEEGLSYSAAELYEIEHGTTMQFRMRSRSGVEDGQVYTTKKTVTLLAGEPHA